MQITCSWQFLTKQNKMNPNKILCWFWAMQTKTNSIEYINLVSSRSGIDNIAFLLTIRHIQIVWYWNEAKWKEKKNRRCNIFHMNLINLGSKFIVSPNHGHFHFILFRQGRRCVIAYNFYRSTTIIYHIFISILDLVFFVGSSSLISISVKNLNPRNPVSFESILHTRTRKSWTRLRFLFISFGCSWLNLKRIQSSHCWFDQRSQALVS